MAIGTPVEIGSNTGNATPLVITTTATAAVGSTIVLVVAQQGNLTVTSVTDSAGNTYTQDKTANQGSEAGALYSAPVTTQLASGGTISVAFSGGANTTITAIADTGVGALDATGSATGNSAAPSASATTVDAITLVIGFVAENDGTSPTQPGAPWTGLTTVNGTGADIIWAYQIASVAGVKTYAPTLGGGGTQWVDLVVSYKALIDDPDQGLYVPPRRVPLAAQGRFASDIAKNSDIHTPGPMPEIYDSEAQAGLIWLWQGRRVRDTKDWALYLPPTWVQARSTRRDARWTPPMFDLDQAVVVTDVNDWTIVNSPRRVRLLNARQPLQNVPPDALDALVTDGADWAKRFGRPIKPGPRPGAYMPSSADLDHADGNDDAARVRPPRRVDALNRGRYLREWSKDAADASVSDGHDWAPAAKGAPKERLRGARGMPPASDLDEPTPLTDDSVWAPVRSPQRVRPVNVRQPRQDTPPDFLPPPVTDGMDWAPVGRLSPKERLRGARSAPLPSAATDPAEQDWQLFRRVVSKLPSRGIRITLLATTGLIAPPDDAGDWALPQIRAQRPRMTRGGREMPRNFDLDVPGSGAASNDGWAFQRARPKVPERRAGAMIFLPLDVADHCFWHITDPATGSWSGATPASGSWSAASPASGSWTPASAAPGSWTPTTPAGGTWTAEPQGEGDGTVCDDA